MHGLTVVVPDYDTELRSSLQGLFFKPQASRIRAMPVCRYGYGVYGWLGVDGDGGEVPSSPTVAMQRIRGAVTGFEISRFSSHNFPWKYFTCKNEIIDEGFSYLLSITSSSSD